MGALSRIKTKVRALVDDLSQTITDEFTYVGDNKFQLTESNPIALVKTEINGNDLGSGESASLDSDTNEVTITASLSTNDVITIKYTYYAQYSDTEIESYIEGALAYISNEGVNDFRFDGTEEEFYPILTQKQENLVALITAIIMKPNYSRYSLSNDLTIQYPRTKSKEEKIIETIFRYNSGILGEFGVI